MEHEGEEAQPQAYVKHLVTTTHVCTYVKNAIYFHDLHNWNCHTA